MISSRDQMRITRNQMRITATAICKRKEQLKRIMLRPADRDVADQYLLGSRSNYCEMMGAESSCSLPDT